MYNNYNPYMQPRFQQPMQPQYNPQSDTQSGLQLQFNGQQFIKSGLQGKQVDSLEVVKATDVPFDGSISYFPLTDGTTIVTKQLQMDGTSKIIVFKPVEEDNTTKFITAEDLDAIKADLKTLKKQVKELKKSEDE